MSNEYQIKINITLDLFVQLIYFSFLLESNNCTRIVIHSVVVFNYLIMFLVNENNHNI